MARQPKAEKAIVSDTADTAVETPSVTRRSLFERLTGYLDANDWHYSADQEKGVVSMGVRLKDTSARVFMEAYESEEWQRVLTFTTYPVYVPEGRRAAVLETLNRINLRILFGNFEMDPADGEIRFRTTVEAESGLGDPLFERVLDSNVTCADRHFGALMAVAFGNAAPEAAIEMTSRPASDNLQ